MLLSLDGKPITNNTGWENMVETFFSSPEGNTLLLSSLANQELVCSEESSFIPELESCSESWPFSFDNIGPRPPLQHFIASPTKANATLARIERDQTNFWNLLVDTVSLLPYWPFQDTPIDILDVGCGMALDATSLHAYFGGTDYPQPGKNVTYTGIDINAKAIEKATALHHDRDDLQFIVADATDLTPVFASMANTVKKDGFEVAVIRHQNASNTPEIWRDIFSETWSRLRPGGILIVTSYTCLEHEVMTELMSDIGAEPFIEGRNPNAEMALTNDDPTGLLKRDKFVTLFWKPDNQVL